MKKRSVRMNGLTLVELLVVFVVLLFSVMIIFPAAGRAREDEGLARCLSKMREMGLAFGFYAGDYDDYLPVDYQNHNRMNHIRHSQINLVTGVRKLHFGSGVLLRHGYLDNPASLYCPAATSHAFDPEQWSEWAPGSELTGGRTSYSYYLGRRNSRRPHSGNIDIRRAWQNDRYSREFDAGNEVLNGGLAEITSAQFIGEGRDSMLSDSVIWSGGEVSVYNHGHSFNVLSVTGAARTVALADEELFSGIGIGGQPTVFAPTKRFAYFDFKK